MMQYSPFHPALRLVAIILANTNLTADFNLAWK